MSRDVSSAPSSVSVALLTPPGRGALAVVGVAGQDAALLVDRCFEPRTATPVAARADGAIGVGRWRADPNGPGEELVVVRHRADLLEVHCHGGLAAPAAVLASLVKAGACQVSWSQWFARTGDSAITIEAREALARAGGPKAARILARQLAGALDRELERIEVLQSTDDPVTAAAAAERLLRAARVGLRLTRPWRVVLVGAVNAGKSSLANALAGHARCLVSPLPGTTRDLVETRLVLDGWELDLVDTAGLRDGNATLGATEQAGIARAAAARAEADLVLRVIPAADFERERPVLQADELVVISKCDRGTCGLGPASATDHGAGVRTSAVSAFGIDALADRIVAALVPEERDAADLLAGAVPFTHRQVATVMRLRSSPSSSGPSRGA